MVMRNHSADYEMHRTTFEDRISRAKLYAMDGRYAGALGHIGMTPFVIEKASSQAVQKGSDKWGTIEMERPHEVANSLGAVAYYIEDTIGASCREAVMKVAAVIDAATKEDSFWGVPTAMAAIAQETERSGPVIKVSDMLLWMPQGHWPDVFRNLIAFPYSFAPGFDRAMAVAKTTDAIREIGPSSAPVVMSFAGDVYAALPYQSVRFTLDALDVLAHNSTEETVEAVAGRMLARIERGGPETVEEMRRVGEAKISWSRLKRQLRRLS